MAVLHSQHIAPDNANRDSGLTATEFDSLQAATRGSEEPLELGTDNQLEDRWSRFSGIHDVEGKYVPEQGAFDSILGGSSQTQAQGPTPRQYQQRHRPPTECSAAGSQQGIIFGHQE